MVLSWLLSVRQCRACLMNDSDGYAFVHLMFMFMCLFMYCSEQSCDVNCDRAHDMCRMYRQRYKTGPWLDTYS